jgi:hypothetical protein
MMTVHSASVTVVVYADTVYRPLIKADE